MSELRVDNIVSEDGSAAPIYSKGMTIGAGQTLTCTGDFSVGGNVTFDSGATVTGVVTFSSADLQTNLSLTGLSVSGVSTFSDTVEVGAGKSIKLNGATSGYTEIVAAAGSGSTTFVLPANGGSPSQYLQTDGSGVLSWAAVAQLSNAEDGTGTNFEFNSGYGSNATAYGIRAWIYFNGESGSIGSGLGSGNVSTVTDNGTGDYTVSFSNTMPDTNYAVVTGLGDISNNSDAGYLQAPYITAPSTSAYRFRTVDQAYSNVFDNEYVYLAFIR